MRQMAKCRTIGAEPDEEARSLSCFLSGKKIEDVRC